MTLHPLHSGNARSLQSNCPVDVRVTLITIVICRYLKIFEVYYDEDDDVDGDLLDSGVSFCQVSFFMNFSTERPPVYLMVMIIMIMKIIMI